MYNKITARKTSKKYKTNNETNKKTKNTAEQSQVEEKPVTDVIANRKTVRVEPNQITELNIIESVTSNEDAISESSSASTSTDAQTVVVRLIKDDRTQLPSNLSTLNEPPQTPRNAVIQSEKQKFSLPKAQRALIIEEPRIYHSITVDLEELLSPIGFAKLLIYLVQEMDNKYKYRKRTTMSKIFERLKKVRRLLPRFLLYYSLFLGLAYILTLGLEWTLVIYYRPKVETFWERQMRKLRSLLQMFG